jgi:hypothetical protein
MYKQLEDIRRMHLRSALALASMDVFVCVFSSMLEIKQVQSRETSPKR